MEILNPWDTLTCRGLKDERYLTKETQKDYISMREENVVPGNQMKRMFQGGSDQLGQIL